MSLEPWFLGSLSLAKKLRSERAARRQRAGRLLKLEALELRALMHGDADSVSAILAPPAHVDLGLQTASHIAVADAQIFTASSDPVALPAEGHHDDGGHNHGEHHHEVEVTATEIISNHDIVPRFAAQPTITALRSGSWTSASVWSLGRVPRAGDRVSIPAGVDLTYNAVSNAAIDAIEIAGSVRFARNVNTRLTFSALTVLPGGKLEVGTAAAPIAASVKAELVIADKPLNLAADPRQFGNALLVFGQLTMHGAAIQQTWSRLAAEVHAGDTSILVEAAGNWRVGQTLLLPDTHQLRSTEETEFFQGSLVPQWEQAVISRIEGNQVYLTEPVKFDHLGARSVDGNLELLGHVALLDRNVIVRSENANGNRGHTMFAGRAEIDVRYARFQDLGRTDAFRALDSTTFDAQGNVTHQGTNHIGRYAVHIHHLLGAENATNTGYQYRFTGNTVDGSKRWAVALHDSHYGLVDRNVVYNAQGAGIVTEDGSEIGNEITNNITIRIQGTLRDGDAGTNVGDYGRGGVGFWFRRSGNIVRGNVAADSSYAGYVFSSYDLTGEVVLPVARGVSKEENGIHALSNPAGVFEANEAYGPSQHGLWAAFPSGSLKEAPILTIQDLRLWHTGRSYAVVAYHTSNLVFDDLLMLADPSVQDRADWGTTAFGLSTYENNNLVIRNSRIEGFRIGIVAPVNDASNIGASKPTLVQNTTLNNYRNVIVRPADDGRPSYGNGLVLRNVKFLTMTRVPKTTAAVMGQPYNIMMAYTDRNKNLTQPSTVQVYDYNQVRGVNFQVYYHEHVAGFVMPQTGAGSLTEPRYEDGSIGSPEAGLTNAQNNSKYHITTAGAIAPTSGDANYPKVYGIVAPIAAGKYASRVTIVTPWEGAIVDGDVAILRFTVNGKLAATSKVFVTLDGRQINGDFSNGRFIFNYLSAGWHNLRMYIGDAATGVKLSGTSDSVVRFRSGGLTAPTGFTAVAASSTKVNVAWQPVEGANSYEVERSVDLQTWTIVKSASATSTQLTSLLPGELYYFRVRAIGSLGSSPPSAIVLVTMPAPQNLLAPASMSATVVSGGVRVTWSNVAGESGYVIERSANPEDFVEIARVGVNTTTFIDWSAAGGVRYLYRVKAVNGSVSSPYARTVWVMVPPGTTGQAASSAAAATTTAAIRYSEESPAAAPSTAEALPPKTTVLPVQIASAPLQVLIAQAADVALSEDLDAAWGLPAVAL